MQIWPEVNVREKSDTKGLSRLSAIISGYHVFSRILILQYGVVCSAGYCLLSAALSVQ